MSDPNPAAAAWAATVAASRATYGLPPGLYMQVYRGAIRGDHATALAHELATWGHSPSVAGVALHGVNAEMSEAAYAALAALAAAHGRLCLAAFGLGDSHPTAYGEMIGRFAARDDCAATVWDMEGSWENEADDPAKAQRMFDAYAASAHPDKLTVDQCWFVPTFHHAFPWPQTAARIKLRAPQVYHNDFKPRWGRERYAKVEAWHARSWTEMESEWHRDGVPVRPHVRTIQGYGWSDIPYDLVTCLLANQAQPTLVWCDPFPTPAFLAGVAVVDALRARGYYGPTAVADYQRENGLAVDGKAGAATRAALGLPPPVAA